MFLASAASSFLTGAVMPVDGGYIVGDPAGKLNHLGLQPGQIYWDLRPHQVTGPPGVEGRAGRAIKLAGELEGLVGFEMTPQRPQDLDVFADTYQRAINPGAGEAVGSTGTAGAKPQ